MEKYEAFGTRGQPIYPVLEGRRYDWPIWEAAEYIRNVIGDADEQNCYPTTLTALRQAALDNRIHIFGKRELPPPKASGFPSDVWTSIHSDYWVANRLNPMATGAMWQSHDHTCPEPLTVNGYCERYWTLLVNRGEIETQWPLGWSDWQVLFVHWQNIAQREFEALRDRANSDASLKNRFLSTSHIKLLMDAAIRPVLNMLELARAKGPPENIYHLILVEAEMAYDRFVFQVRRTVNGTSGRRTGAAELAYLETERGGGQGRIQGIFSFWAAEDRIAQSPVSRPLVPDNETRHVPGTRTDDGAAPRQWSPKEINEFADKQIRQKNSQSQMVKNAVQRWPNIGSRPSRTALRTAYNEAAKRVNLTVSKGRPKRDIRGK